MSKTEFMEYVEKNFLGASEEYMSLLGNVLDCVALQGLDAEEQHQMLHFLLMDTIGLTEEEIEKVVL